MYEYSAVTASIVRRRATLKRKTWRKNKRLKKNTQTLRYITAASLHFFQKPPAVFVKNLLMLKEYTKM